MLENNNQKFNHIKIHSQYSICEGALKISDLANYCKENKIRAAGLCDSNNLCGALEFSELIAKSKTQPIIGSQINIKYKDNSGKIPIFAKNLEGYKNLIKLSSKSFLEISDGEEPHCKVEDVEVNHKGLILLSGSFDGLIGKLFSKNLTDEISSLLQRLKKTFNDNFYLEIQRHNDDGEKLFEKFLLNTSENLEIPIIATHEVFYLDKDMHEAHDAYLCIGEKTYVHAKDRKKYSDSHYLTSPEEMHQLFKDLPDALENNVSFAKRILYRPKNSPPVLPDIQTSESKNINDLLVRESEEGLREKLEKYILPYLDQENKIKRVRKNSGQKNSEEIINFYKKRLKHEIEIITKMKYSSYFLIVSDYIKWAKNNDIPVGPGRGSGAGSLVAWALSITDIDPIKFDLIFERFLNPDRISMPDFDIDFCEEKRDKVFEYLKKKIWKRCSPHYYIW